MNETQIKTVETDTFSMEYFKFGQGKKTLVILPGLSVQSVMGFAVAVAQAYRPLTADFTVYVFDRRKELPAEYAVAEMARDTAEAIEALGLEKVCVFGASQGGMIAMEIAIEHPELIDKLILGSTSARVTESQYEAIDKWIRLAKENDSEALYLAFGEDIYSQDIFKKSRELLTETAKSVTEEDLRRFIILAEGIKGFDVTDDLVKITCPVLVIGDTDDRALGSEASKFIVQCLDEQTDAELFLYEGYGHAVYDTAPDYKERLMHFLAPG